MLPPRHLLGPVTKMSAWTCSGCTSMPPKEETASTMVSTSCARQISPISRTGLTVPEGVSWWQTESTRMSGRASSMSLTDCGSIASS